MGNPFGNDPVAFFGSMAGPSAADLFGPPNGVLDVNVDGTPMALAQMNADQALPTGGAGPWYARKDVHALLALLVGAWAIHQATK